MHTPSGVLSRRALLRAAVAVVTSLVAASSEANVVYAADGMPVTWQLRGTWTNSPEAQQIGSCGNQFVVIWDGATLWFSGDYGNNGSWISTYGNPMPPNTTLKSFTCYDSAFVFLDTNDNLWFWAGTNGWENWGSGMWPSGVTSVLSIGGWSGVMTAIGATHHLMWVYEDPTSQFSGPPESSGWQDVGLGPSAARIVGSRAYYGDNQGRFYGINMDGTLWYSDTLVVDHLDSWLSFPKGAGVATPIDIAATETGVYVLDSDHQIWTAWTNAETVPYIQAPEFGWGGPMILQMIGAYAGQDYEACVFENLVYTFDGGTCCTEPTKCVGHHFAPWGTIAPDPYPLNTALQKAGYDASYTQYYTTAPDAAALSNALNNYQPTVFVWDYPLIQDSHQMLAVGAYGSPGDDMTVTVNDPGPNFPSVLDAGELVPAGDVVDMSYGHLMNHQDSGVYLPQYFDGIVPNFGFPGSGW